jgi:hypothetical protein
MFEFSYLRNFYSLRAKLLRKAYINKWGFTPEKAMMKYGKYIQINECKAALHR